MRTPLPNELRRSKKHVNQSQAIKKYLERNGCCFTIPGHDLCVFAIINPLEFFYERLAEVTDVCSRTTETDPTEPKKGFKNGKHIEPVKSPITLQLLYEMY